MAIGGAMSRMFKLPPRIKSITSAPVPRGPAPHYEWEKLCDDFLWKWYNDPARRTSRRQGIFHPSAGLHPDSGLCQRMVIFDLLYAPYSPTAIQPSLAKRLINGTNRHVGLQDLFGAMADEGYMAISQAEHEVPAQHPMLPLFGHADERLTIRGHQYIFDFKTMSDAQCKKTFEPSHKHRIQLNTYMGILRTPTGYMIYENKDSQKWVGPLNKFRVEFDQQMYAETEQFCTEILILVANESMPKFNDGICRDNLTFCPYAAVCTKERSTGTAWSEFDRRPEIVKKLHLRVIQ